MSNRTGRGCDLHAAAGATGWRTAGRVGSHVAAAGLLLSIVLLGRSGHAATASDPFPSLRVGLGGVAVFPSDGAMNTSVGLSLPAGFALDVNVGLVVHRPGAAAHPLAPTRLQLFLAPEVGYHFQGSPLGGHRMLLGLGIGAGQANRGWAVAYMPRFVAGQAGDVQGVGVRNGIAAYFVGTTFGIEIAHQLMFVAHGAARVAQHELVVMATLNPLTPLTALGLWRAGKLSP